MKNKKLLECLFGHHDYDEKATKDRYDWLVHICKVCKRSAYRRLWGGCKIWRRYDERGHLIYMKYVGGGVEYWYDENGKCIRVSRNGQVLNF